MRRRARPKQLPRPRRAYTRGALARVAGPGRGRDLRLERTGLARGPRPRRGTRTAISIWSSKTSAPSCTAAPMTLSMAGGWHPRTGSSPMPSTWPWGALTRKPLSRTERLVLTAIGYFQPITRGELSQLFGKEVSRDIIGLPALNFIAAGPRNPQPGARYTYVRTKQFPRTSASTRSATYPTSSSSRRPVCSANRSCSPARV